MIFKHIPTFRRKKTINEIYQRLAVAPFFRTVDFVGNNEIVMPTGCVYGDQTDLILFLTKRDDTLFLTDNGRTRTYMDKVFELKSEDVIKNIEAVTNYYGISIENKQLSLKIGTIHDYIEGFLRMVYCIGFLNTMEIFYENPECRKRSKRLHKIISELTFESFFCNIIPQVMSSIDFRISCNYHGNRIQEVFSIQETVVGIFLSDNGITLVNLDDIFELKEPDVIKNIVTVLNHFNIRKEGNAFTYKIDTLKDEIPQILHYLQGINFLYGMKLFYSKGD